MPAAAIIRAPAVPPPSPLPARTRPPPAAGSLFRVAKLGPRPEPRRFPAAQAFGSEFDRPGFQSPGRPRRRETAPAPPGRAARERYAGELELQVDSIQLQLRKPRAPGGPGRGTPPGRVGGPRRDPGRPGTKVRAPRPTRRDHSEPLAGWRPDLGLGRTGPGIRTALLARDRAGPPTVTVGGGP